jgi:CheY-like chemotaxis protein
MTTPPSILVVEDEAVIGLDLQLQLPNLGYRVIGPAASGAATAARLAAASNMAVDFLSAHNDAATVARARRARRCSFASKPFATATLQAVINEILLRKSSAACRGTGCI